MPKISELAAATAITGSEVLAIVQAGDTKKVAAGLLRSHKIDVRNFGADPTGVASSSSAFEAAIAASSDGSTIYVPSGSYDLQSLAGALSISGNNKAIVSDGIATLNFGGGPGFQFTDAAASDWLFSGLDIVNASVGIGSINTVDSRNFEKTNITIEHCTIRDKSGSGMIAGIYLRNAVKNIRVLNCTIKNLHSTNHSCSGIWIGRKGDASSPAWSYSESGAVGSAEADIIVSGCAVQNITTDSNSGTETQRENHGILADGWRVRVTNNTLDTMSNAYTNGEESEGLYMRCFDGLVMGNSFKDAGKGNYVIHKGATSSTYGDLCVEYFGNTFRTVSILPRRIFSVANDNCRIFRNAFRRCQLDNTVEAIIGMSSIANDVYIDDNIFQQCAAYRHINLRGSRVYARRNYVVDPVGASSASTNVQIINWQGADQNDRDIAIEDNIVELGASWAGTGTTNCCFSAEDGNASGRVIENVSIKRNRVTGLSLIPSGTFRPYRVIARQVGYVDWIVDENEIEGPIRQSSVGRPIDLGSMTQWPDRFVARTLWRTPYTPGNTTITLALHESGAWITNEGAGTIRTATLPVATPGLEFRFSRLANFAYRIVPNGSDVIGSGGAGKYLEIESNGGGVHLRCVTGGAWILLSASGPISYEA